VGSGSRKRRHAIPYLSAAGLLAAMTMAAWHASAYGQGAPLTLADAVAIAVRRSDGVRIAALESEQAQAAVGSERSAYLPHLGITSGAGYSNRQNEKLRALDANGNERVYGLQSIGMRNGWFNVEVEQLIVDIRRWRRIDQRQLAAAAAAAAADEQGDAAARDVTIAYANVLRAEALRALAAERVRQASWLDEQAALLLRAGRALAVEREQIAIAAGEAALEVRTRDDQVAHARAALQLAIGDPAVDVSRLDAASVPPPEPPPGDFASDATLAATPALRVLELRRRVEESGIGAARAERYPTIGVRAGYSNYGPHRYDNYTDEVGVHVAVEVPIFDGNRAAHDTAGASKAAEIARLRYAQALADARTRVRDLANRLAAAGERLAFAERRAALSREQVRLVDLRLQAQRAALAEAEAARAAFGRDAIAAIDARWERVELWTALMTESGHLLTMVGGDRRRGDQVEKP